jgi:hypothetical protein
LNVLISINLFHLLVVVVAVDVIVDNVVVIVGFVVVVCDVG